MINPAPSASLEGFGESSLLFGLYTFVPEPGLSGDVKHRLCAEIQRRFTQEGIVIPYPTLWRKFDQHIYALSRRSRHT